MPDTSSVSSLIEQLKREKLYKDRRKQGKEQRVTAMLSEHDFKRLRYISKELGLIRSSFIRKVLIEALNDAERILGLHEQVVDEGLTLSMGDGDTYYSFTEYGHFLRSNDEDDDNDEEAGSDKD